MPLAQNRNSFGNLTPDTQITNLKRVQRYSTVVNPRAGGQSATRYPPTQSQAPANSNLGNFRFPWEINQPGREFSSAGIRLREPTFDEMRNRLNPGMLDLFGKIGRGEDFETKFVRRKRYDANGKEITDFNPLAKLDRVVVTPGLNVDFTPVDVSGAQRANSQRFSAQRQAAARGAIGTFGNRLGARSGGAGLAAINQSAAPLFAAEAGANASLQAGAAFQNQASEQATDQFNINTRLFGIQGRRDMLDFFQKEAGQRADIGIRRGGLQLGREELKVNKEGQDLRAALEKQRLGILSFTAGEQVAFNKEQMRLAWAELQEKIEQGFYGGGNTGAIDWANAFTDFVDAVVPG